MNSFLAGHVPGEGGPKPFCVESENLGDRDFHQQPCQFQPRLDWSHEEIRYLDESLSPDQVTAALGSVAPMPTWFTQEERPTLRKLGIKSWEYHCQSLWEGALRLRRGAWASSEFLESLLVILHYGHEDVIAPTNYFLVLDDKMALFRNPKHDVAGSCLQLPEGASRARIHYSFSSGSSKDWRLEMYTRRFFVGMINFHDRHWVSFIWDRLIGQLYVYDTDKKNRTTRLKAIVCAWREVLAKAGMPFDFDFVAYPVTAQPGDYECGYLSMYLLFANLRGLVGQSYEQLVAVQAPKTMRLDNENLYAPSTFGLPYRDWTFDPRNLTDQEISDSWDFVQDFFMTLICNELGVAGRSLLSHGHEFSLCTNPTFRWERLEEDPTIDHLRRFTEFGGYQFLVWPGKQLGGYGNETARYI
ncbi:MAG: hypothetical protein KIT69_08330, partial [Propionibacteriaceae bacterium]|nr:hypothetical protein [Propionibacteriaceae bacterium]